MLKLLKIREFIVATLPALLYLLFTHKQYLTYLEIPNRHLTAWDPTLHIKDGYVFYLQLKQLDFLSFFYSFISLNFWLPLHPLLIALTSFFTGYSPDAYTALNFIFVAVGISASVWIYYRSTNQIANAVTFALGLLAFCIKIGNSRLFYDTHLSVMLESLGFAITLVFGTSFYLELIDPRATVKFLVKSSCVSLSLLLFTKIQYGMFFAFSYISFHIWKERQNLFGKTSWITSVLIALLKRRGFLITLIILNLFGAFALFTKNRFSHLGFGVPDGLWAYGFSVVLICTWIWRSKKTDIFELRNKLPSAIGQIVKFIVIPFGWYYLFPFRNKIRWLLFNSATPTSESILRQLLLLPNQFNEFLGMGNYCFWIVVGVFVLLIVSSSKNEEKRSSTFWVIVTIISFYIPMTFFAGAHYPRLITTWIGLIFTFFIAALTQVLSGRVNAAFATIFFVSTFLFLPGDSEMSEMKRYLVKGFLNPEHQGVQLALNTFDFKKPGIIYGLGKTMDSSTTIYELEAIKNNPKNASFLPLSGKIEIYANNFGKSGNENPVDTIRSLTSKPQMSQLLLFHSGFTPDEMKKISEDLLSPQKSFIQRMNNEAFVYFAR